MGLISGKSKWIDPAIHVVAAILIVGFGALMNAAWPVAVVQSVFWFSREVEQDVAKKITDGREIWPVWPFRHSTQKWVEFLSPVIAGFIMAVIAS